MTKKYLDIFLSPPDLAYFLMLKSISANIKTYRMSAKTPLLANNSEYELWENAFNELYKIKLPEPTPKKTLFEPTSIAFESK